MVGAFTSSQGISLLSPQATSYISETARLLARRDDYYDDNDDGFDGFDRSRSPRGGGSGDFKQKKMIGTDLEEEDGEEDEEVEEEGGEEEEEEDRDSSLVNHHQHSRVLLKLQKPMHISLVSWRVSDSIGTQEVHTAR